MAKDGKHVIHAGGVFPNPLLNREGRATAVKPGTLGFFDAGVFKVSVDGRETAIIYVADFDYLRCIIGLCAGDFHAEYGRLEQVPLIGE